MVQGQKVLAANLDRSLDLNGENLAEWLRISAELASSPDLSEARMVLGMKVRVLPLWSPLRNSG
jgi:hypothetical protein